MEQIKEKIEELGATPYAIGNGTPLMAMDFVDSFNITFQVFTDPERNSYKAMNFKRNFGLGFRALKRGVEASNKGHRQGKVQGDIWQQGGEAIFLKGGRLIWTRPSTSAGDHADPETLLAEVARISSYGRE